MSGYSLPEAATCVILGGGGHACVLIDALVESGVSRRLVILDANATRWGSLLFDVPVIGGDDRLAALAATGATHFIVGLGGAGDNTPRRRLYASARALALLPLSVVHPRATISRWARIGPGAQLLAAAIVNANADLGEGVIVNSGAIVEHDCRIGDYVHVASGARVASGVTVAAGAHIGAGATIRELVMVGANAVVGAGAVVVKDVPAGQTVAGVPAVPLERRRRVAAER